MIEIKLGTENIELKNNWNELTSEEFVFIVGLLNRYLNEEFDLYELRLQIFQVLTGYERSTKEISDEDRAQINDNIYLLSNMLIFPTKPYYPDPEVLDVLSPELQYILKSRFPFEVHEEEYQDQLEMVKKLLKYSAAPNYGLKHNPLKSFKFEGKTYHGPTISIDKNGVFKTDIIAGEYVSALEYYLINRSVDRKYLKDVAAFLYRPKREIFDKQACKKRAEKFEKLPENILAAIEFIFQNLQETIINMPEIGILYKRRPKKKDENKLSIGVSETIYNLSQDGYGSKAEIDQLPLEDYLKLMLKQLKDYVDQLRGMDKDDMEIAKKTGLDISIVKNI